LPLGQWDKKLRSSGECDRDYSSLTVEDAEPPSPTPTDAADMDKGEGEGEGEGEDEGGSALAALFEEKGANAPRSVWLLFPDQNAAASGTIMSYAIGAVTTIQGLARGIQARAGLSKEHGLSSIGPDDELLIGTARATDGTVHLVKGSLKGASLSRSTKATVSINGLDQQLITVGLRKSPIEVYKVSTTGTSEVSSSEFEVGETVRVRRVTKDEAKDLQTGHGGINDSMIAPTP